MSAVTVTVTVMVLVMPVLTWPARCSSNGHAAWGSLEPRDTETEIPPKRV